MKLRYAVLAVALVAAAGCGSDSPTAPTPTPTTQPPGPVTYNIQVRVRDASNSRGLAEAVLEIIDGIGDGQTFTTGEDGTITLTGAEGSVRIQARHTGFRRNSERVQPCASNGCTATLEIRLQRSSPWRIQGVGSSVRSMPTDIRRVRVQATFNGFSENFAVWVGGRPGGLIVNELVGTFWGLTNYSGTFSVEGGDVDVEGTGVSWSLTQVYR